MEAEAQKMKDRERLTNRIRRGPPAPDTGRMMQRQCLPALSRGFAVPSAADRERSEVVRIAPSLANKAHRGGVNNIDNGTVA